MGFLLTYINLLFQKLEEQITKNSSTLGRDAKFNRKVGIVAVDV